MHLSPRIFKLVSSLCLVLSTSALVMIARAPASGYEISIYTTNLSPLVWVLLISSMSGSIFLLVPEALNRDNESNRWLLPFFILAFSSLIVLLLPALKGYVMYGREDPPVHLGFTKDILSTGHFSDDNFYPAVHILESLLSQVTGLSVESLINFIPPLFSFGYMLFIYLLIKSVCCHKGEIVFASASGAILLLPHTALAVPFYLSLLEYPLGLAVFVRAYHHSSFESRLLLILILLLQPFLHPMAAGMAMLTLILAYLVQAGYFLRGCLLYTSPSPRD